MPGTKEPPARPRRRVVESPTWIVVPVRSLTDGKRRLAPVLAPDERAALVRRLFLRTLEAATAVGPPVLVVSPDPAALALARGRGAAGLEEPRPIGLNHALGLAAREAAGRGAGAVQAGVVDGESIHSGKVPVQSIIHPRPTTPSPGDCII